MKRYLLSFAFMLMNLMPLLAYDRHGRDYSVRDGGGASGVLVLIIIIGFVAFCIFGGGKKKQ